MKVTKPFTTFDEENIAGRLRRERFFVTFKSKMMQ